MDIKFLGDFNKDRGVSFSLVDAIKDLDIRPNWEVLGKAQDFLKYGVRAPAAIVINGKVVFKGHRISFNKIRNILQDEVKRENGDL